MRHRRRWWWAPAVFLLLLLTATSVTDACQTGCRCWRDEGGVVAAQCDAAKLRAVPFMLDPRTTHLSLRDNQIRRLTGADELAIYPSLLALDLSNNSLSELPAGVFSAAANLTQLKLAHNSLRVLPDAAFRSLQNLKRLDLSHNALVLAPGLLSELSALEELDLSYNELTYVPPDFFRGLTRLRILRLAHNKLLDIPNLSELRSLEHLDLSSNLISQIGGSALHAQRALKFLDLSRNLLISLSAEELRGLASLQHLKMEANQLERFTGRVWEYVEGTLERLDLAYNYIQKIDEKTFEGLEQLKVLNLTHSTGLAEIGANGLESLKSMEVLSFRNSDQLHSIDADAFGHSTPPLSVLDVAGCALSSLASFDRFSSELSTVAAAGNAWHCDCALLAILGGAHRLVDGARCAGPALLQGQLVESLASCSWMERHKTETVVCLAFLVLTLASIVGILCCRMRRRRGGAQKTPGAMMVASNRRVAGGSGISIEAQHYPYHLNAAHHRLLLAAEHQNPQILDSDKGRSGGVASNAATSHAVYDKGVLLLSSSSAFSGSGSSPAYSTRRSEDEDEDIEEEEDDYAAPDDLTNMPKGTTKESREDKRRKKKKRISSSTTATGTNGGGAGTATTSASSRASGSGGSGDGRGAAIWQQQQQQMQTGPDAARQAIYRTLAGAIPPPAMMMPEQHRLHQHHPHPHLQHHYQQHTIYAPTRPCSGCCCEHTDYYGAHQQHPSQNAYTLSRLPRPPFFQPPLPPASTPLDGGAAGSADDERMPSGCYVSVGPDGYLQTTTASSQFASPYAATMRNDQHRVPRKLPLWLFPAEDGILP